MTLKIYIQCGVRVQNEFFKSGQTQQFVDIILKMAKTWKNVFSYNFVDI